MKASRQLPGSAQTSFGERLRMDLSRHWPLYLMVLPAVVVIAVFSYGPMYGVVIAFKNFKPAYGISGSRWVGLRNFERFFSSYQFKNTLLNTLSISIYSMLACFPAPVILALMMDQVRSKSTQRFIQTVTYMPHFISVIVVSGMILTFLNVNTGLYGNLARLLGDEAFEALVRHADDDLAEPALVEAAEQRKIIQNAARKNKMKSQRSTLSFDQRKTELAKFFPESIFPVIQSFSFFSTEEIFFQSSVKLKGIKSCDISFNK